MQIQNMADIFSLGHISWSSVTKSKMYSSLMDHSTAQPYQVVDMENHHYDLETARMPALSEKSSLVDNKEDSQNVWTPSRREVLIMVTCAVSSLIVALDATILISVLPTLATDLHGTASDAFVSHDQTQ